MKLLKTATYEIKRSKFCAFLYEIDSKEEVKKIFDELKKEHKKARHIPYAYFFQNTAGKSDDKEPANTAGTPIYRILETSNYRNHVLFVVRYYGGIKLGAGGLIRSYSEAAKKVIN
ncbi:MAG: YigZ family protein [Bacilli bacterium]|nr:YigZ family protein [Bacilli bacterium]